MPCRIKPCLKTIGKHFLAARYSVEIDGNTVQTMTRDGAAPPQILRDVLGILNEILRAT